MATIEDWDFCLSNNTLIYAQRPTVGAIRVRGRVFGRYLTKDGNHITTSVIQSVKSNDDGTLEVLTASGSAYTLGAVCEQYARMVPKYLGVLHRKECKAKVVAKYGEEFVAALGTKTDRDIAAEFGKDPSTVTRVRNRLRIPSLTAQDSSSDRRHDARVIVTFPDGLNAVSEDIAVEMFLQALNKAREQGNDRQRA